MRIAVIDSGVHPAHDHIDPSRLLSGVAIRSDGGIEDGPDATLDRLGHGTAVMAAIQEKAPQADCIPLRVFHESLKTSALALITAMDLAVARGADVINLSLGSINPAHARPFAAAVARANAAGAVVVAPCEHGGDPCFPGALPGVIAVKVDWDCPRETFWPDRDRADTFAVSGYPRPIPGVPPRRNLYGISFATAQMSGFTARILQGLCTDPADRLVAVRRALVGAALSAQQPQPCT